MSKKIKTTNLANQIIGKWKVLYYAEDKVFSNGQKHPMWMCECQCSKHTKRLVDGYSLIHGGSLSCGCLNGLSNKKYNQYDLSGKFGIGYTSKGEKFYFDLDDYDKIKDYCWDIDKSNHYTKTIFNNKKLYLHRLVMNCKYQDGLIIDHINRQRNDCRKNNLRYVTTTQSAINKGIKATNTSGKIGVSFSKLHQKWESYITINCKRIHLGLFNDFDEAVKVRKEAEDKYFGEYNPI